jgi:hypothetical protein
MYCHFCGRPPVGTCPVCHHRICPLHRRRWLLLPVCRKCRGSLWVGTATVALLATVVAIIFLIARTT